MVDRTKRHKTISKYTGSDLTNWTYSVQVVTDGMMNGKTNNTDSVTLTASVATTVVTLAEGRLGEDTVILFTPTTANAAAEVGAGGLYVSSRAVLSNQFTITHANNAQADRTFNYVLVG